MDETADREITLGTGKLLAMFFALVAVCAVFFGLGYSLGRGAAAAPTAENASQTTPAPTGAKPTAAKAAEPAPASKPPNTDDLTFYKSVEQKDANAQLPADATAAPTTTSAEPAAELTKPAPGGIVVQVAAVSKQEDAEALMTALKKKQYPVFITSNPPSDTLFHVQVGPFTDVNEAEAMKARLTKDGYSPIVKR